MVKVIGTPMIDGSCVHFISHNPGARQVALTGEFNQWDLHGVPMPPLGQTGIFYHTSRTSSRFWGNRTERAAVARGG